MMELQPYTVEREWTVDGIPVLSAVITVPRPASAPDRISRRISRYYQTLFRSYLKYCERDLLPRAETEYRYALSVSAPFTPFRADLNYRITYHDLHFLSLYTQSRETVGQQVLKLRRGDTWDLAAGYPIPLSAFFEHHSPWKRRILEQVSDEIRKQESAGVMQYHAHRRQELRRSFNPQNYYLTDEGLIVFFPMYSIAPPEAGIPVFALPRNTTGPELPVSAPQDQTQKAGARP